MSYLDYFSISFEKIAFYILRFWLEKLNCGFLHSFHLWKNTTKQLFLLKFQCRIVRIWSKKCLIFLQFDSYVLTFNVIFCISSLPILVECSFMFYFWSWSSLLPKCNELKIKSDWKLRSPLSGVSGKIEFLFLIF